MLEADLIRHQVFLLRRANGIYNDLQPQLKAMRDKIKARIATATPNELVRIKSMLKDFNSIIDGEFERIQPKLFNEFQELSIYEGEHALKMLDANTAAAVTIGTGVNDAALIAMVGKSKLFLGDNKGQTIDDLITTFSDRYKKDIKSEIELGLVAGDTTDDIVKRIQALSNGRTREQAKALVLTLANHVGHVARDNVWGDYEDLFEGYEYVATLDFSTTLLCSGRDGKVYPADKFPHLPAHYRCRSIKVPKVKEQYSLGIDTTRSSIDGQVSSKMTYSDWLKTQSKAQQDEILGKARAELFRSGKVTLDKFVDSKGNTYTLAELRAKDLIK